jgi:dihydropteroate synthase
VTPPRGGAPTGTGGTGVEPDAGPPSRTRAAGAWRARGREVLLGHPVVMGIVNLTPDSFSDGGRHGDVQGALDAAEAMVAAGAALVDVGGESTRPGAEGVPPGEELERVLPFLERAASRLQVPITVDTRKAEVARAALEVGAWAVNDVSGLSHDPRMAEVVADAGAGVVLMHMRGEPADMARHARYDDVGAEVAAELGASVARARAAGIPDDAVVVDPGIGFAKTAAHSLALLGDLGHVRALGFPILVGPSRKSFIGALLGVPPEERVAGTLAACVAAYLEGARIFRVHDVGPVVQALAVAEAIAGTRGGVREEHRL